MLGFGRQKTKWQPLSSRSWFITGNSLLIFLAAAAIFIVSFDGLIESGNLKILLGQTHHEHQSLDQLPVRWTELPIDHDDPRGKKYQNRYWINDQWYHPGGPVFVYDVGEGDAESQVERFLQRQTSFPSQLAQEFHGLGILWEHRYYGQSLPYPVNENTTADHFQYLTLNQSLADLPYFADNFHHPSFPAVDFNPKSTPWIIMGCSYSGIRAALSRLEYPDTFFAAYAGSAPVYFNATVNQYDDAIYHSLVDHGHYNCSSDISAMIKYIDTQLDNPQQASALKQQFFGHGAERLTHEQFANVLGAIYLFFKLWGLYDGRPSVAEMCDVLEIDPMSNKTTDRYGWADTRGAKFLVDRLASWPGLLQAANYIYNTTCQRDNLWSDTCHLTSIRDLLGYSWLWQQCSEVGFFHVPSDTGVPTLLSKHARPGGNTSQCEHFFPNISTSSLNEVGARASQTNNVYGGLHMRPSNVFWTTGQYDPWRSLSPLARDQVEVGAASVRVSQDIPASGVSTGPDSIFGYILANTGHCGVLAKNGTESKKAQRLFADALQIWLKDFGK